MPKKNKFGGLLSPDLIYKGEIAEMRSELAHLQAVLGRAESLHFPPTGLTDPLATHMMTQIIHPMHGWLISLIETYFSLILLVQAKRGLGAVIETTTFMSDVQKLHRVFEPVAQMMQQGGPIGSLAQQGSADSWAKAITEALRQLNHK